MAPRRPPNLGVERTFWDAGVEYETAEISMIPKNSMQLPEKETLQVMGLIDTLEDMDDTQQVYSNLDISDEVMAKYEEAA